MTNSTHKLLMSTFNVVQLQPNFPVAASNVLANISIPSNLSQILASIKAQPVAAMPGMSQPLLEAGGTSSSNLLPPPVGMMMPHHAPQLAQRPPQPSPPHIKPLMETLVLPPSPPAPLTYDYQPGVQPMPSNRTSRLAQLTEAELLQMVPDDMLPPLPAKSTTRIPGLRDSSSPFSGH